MFTLKEIKYKEDSSCLQGSITELEVFAKPGESLLSPTLGGEGLNAVLKSRIHHTEFSSTEKAANMVLMISQK